MTEILIEEHTPEVFIAGPVIEKTEHKKVVKIKLVQNIQDVNADLWISFKTSGIRTAHDLFAVHDRTKALVSCAQDGINVTEKHFLFVDSEQLANPSFYLLDAPDQFSEAAWIENLTKACTNFKASTLGLYFGPKDFINNFAEFLNEVLHKIFTLLNLRELYILTHQDDYNLILNEVLDVEKTLDHLPSEFDVFH